MSRRQTPARSRGSTSASALSVREEAVLRGLESGGIVPNRRAGVLCFDAQKRASRVRQRQLFVHDETKRRAATGSSCPELDRIVGLRVDEVRERAVIPDDADRVVPCKCQPSGLVRISRPEKLEHFTAERFFDGISLLL